MPGISVDSRSDKLVVVFLRFLRNVIEIRTRGGHGETSGGLAEENEEDAQTDCGTVHIFSLISREDEVRDEKFDQSAAVGDVVGFAVGEEQEAGGADFGNVVGCCGPEFEEVEDT